jgi:mediator of RNA polymerase II transcription subunit 14
LHYLVVKVSTSSIEFELLRLAREPAENGVGMKLAIRDRSPMDLQRLRQRHLDAKGKRKREEGATALPVVVEPEQSGYVNSIYEVPGVG